MNRRTWLKRSAMMAAAGVAADQLDLVDRLLWKRTLYPSIALGNPYEFNVGFLITDEMLQDMLVYVDRDMIRCYKTSLHFVNRSPPHVRRRRHT